MKDTAQPAQGASENTVAVYRFRVHGRVQGVYFRASAREQAQRLGLGGWVANCADGSVIGMAAGTSDAMNRFRNWLEKGPPAARVAQLAWQPADSAEPLPRPFAIRPDLSA